MGPGGRRARGVQSLFDGAGESRRGSPLSRTRATPGGLGRTAEDDCQNLRLKIREKFLECSGEFSTTPLVAAKLQKYIPLIVVELGP